MRVGRWVFLAFGRARLLGPLPDIGRCVLPFFLGFFVLSWMISFLWLSNLEKSKQRKGSVNGAEMVIAMADKMR